MDRQAQGMAPLGAEVSMLAPEIVRQIRELAGLKWGAKRIAAETGVARGTVKRYLRGGAAAEEQRRPAARRLDADARALAVKLLDGPAQGNGVVVRRLLAERDVSVSLRTLQRVLTPHRQARRAGPMAVCRLVCVHNRRGDICVLGKVVAPLYWNRRRSRRRNAGMSRSFFGCSSSLCSLCSTTVAVVAIASCSSG